MLLTILHRMAITECLVMSCLERRELSKTGLLKKFYIKFLLNLSITYKVFGRRNTGTVVSSVLGSSGGGRIERLREVPRRVLFCSFYF